eukprot:CAMPEP_0181320336 /NCGR_PEP_ID=MMETSP1101-20121128/18069_1 /TAXON_ID=46948 /ORGANISM="Rhodomonas abbreviata, Strain Caron Lab Isolate" /LENGTH=222 /DNA_ID=CAMNT_0023428033 /DNA_START=12 /DNA_END=680 /DNA_ORIENTATION=+
MAPASYGTVEGAEGKADVKPESVQLKLKPSFANKVIPLLAILFVLGACVLVSGMYNAEKVMKQDLYAFEQDDFYNKNIIWDGKQWLDEKTGHAMAMLQQQHPQVLLQTQMLATAAAPAPNYDCCYVPKPGNHNRGVVVDGSPEKVESGMFCHMAVKNMPAAKWPMIRMGNLREAGVSVAPNLGAGMLAANQLHPCHGDLIFKSQDVAVLASAAPYQSLDQIP